MDLKFEYDNVQEFLKSAYDSVSKDFSNFIQIHKELNRQVSAIERIKVHMPEKYLAFEKRLREKQCEINTFIEKIFQERM